MKYLEVQLLGGKQGHLMQRTKLLYLVCVCAQSCPILCNPMDCSPPGSSVHRIFQARILEWVAISFFRGSSWPRDWTLVSCVSCIAGGFLPLSYLGSLDVYNKKEALCLVGLFKFWRQHVLSLGRLFGLHSLTWESSRAQNKHGFYSKNRP